jgi:hypothetical protein
VERQLTPRAHRIPAEGIAAVPAQTQAAVPAATRPEWTAAVVLDRLGTRAG